MKITPELKARVEARMNSVLAALIEVENDHGTSPAILALHEQLAGARDDAVEVFGLGEDMAALRTPGGDKE